MKRIFVALAVLAVAAVVIAGCGGGGGGNGGGGGGGDTATLSGRVLDTSGSPVSGATVAVDTGTTTSKAILSATTNTSGQYSIANVPLGVTFNMSVTSGGNTTQMNGLSIGTDAGSSASMNVVVGGDTIPAGSTVEILPSPLPVYAGETSIAQIKIHNQYGDEIAPAAGHQWKASIVVTGSATAQLSDELNAFGVKGGTVGQNARITVLVVMSNGNLASASQTVTVQDMSLPPPPPL